MILENYHVQLGLGNILGVSKYLFHKMIDKITFVNHTLYISDCKSLAMEDNASVPNLASMTKFTYIFNTEYESKSVLTNNLILCLSNDDISKYIHFMSHDKEIKVAFFHKNRDTDDLKPVHTNNITMQEVVSISRTLLNMVPTETTEGTYKRIFKPFINDVHITNVYDSEGINLSEIESLGAGL